MPVPQRTLFQPPKADLYVHSNPDREFLIDAVREMTGLRNLVVDTIASGGLPFYLLDAILSAPQLCSIQFGPSICLPVEQDASFPKRVRLTGPAPPIVTFRRSLRSYQPYQRTAAEADILYRLFKQIHGTLQVAEMTSDTAPLRAFRDNDWPRLDELVLRGGPRRSSCAFVVENLTRMPNLRVLKLELAQPCGTDPRRICPPDWSGGCPWPRLEVLTISHPHPDVDLYAHLPATLQELTLRCFPRHYVAAAPTAEGRYMGPRGWGPSLRTSAEMRRILCRCGSSLIHLRHLDIEFEESDEDVPLLRHIANTFRTLTFLQILRYHKDPERRRTDWVSTTNVSLCITNNTYHRRSSGGSSPPCLIYAFFGFIST